MRFLAARLYTPANPNVGPNKKDFAGKKVAQKDKMNPEKENKREEKQNKRKLKTVGTQEERDKRASM